MGHLDQKAHPQIFLLLSTSFEKMAPSAFVPTLAIQKNSQAPDGQ